jgi:hypothetical protein
VYRGTQLIIISGVLYNLRAKLKRIPNQETTRQQIKPPSCSNTSHADEGAADETMQGGREREPRAVLARRRAAAAAIYHPPTPAMNLIVNSG